MWGLDSPDMALPALGALIYNGFTFSEKVLTQDFSCKPVPDAAGRTVVYTQFSVTVRDYIVGSPADALVEDARRRLSKYGGQLVMTGRGTGGLNVNVGGTRDVAWGPKPQLVRLRPVGRNNVCEIVWQVDFAIPDCQQAVFQFAAMEYVFRLTMEVDRSGLTRRTYSGFVRVPLTRANVNDRRLPWSADELRERIEPQRVPGFRRVPGAFTLSEDKSRLDFSIADEEFPGPAPPPGCIDWKASHTYSCPDAALLRWVGAIEATYEVAKGFQKSVAQDHFLLLAADRIRAFQRETGGKAFLTGMTIREPELHGRQTAAFTLTYTAIVKKLDDMIAASGLWRPAPTGWREWDATVGDYALGVRGIAGLRFTPGEDALVDLCGVGAPELRTAARAPTRRAELRSRSPFDQPKPEDSWLAYECWVEIENDQGTVELRGVPTAELRSQPPQPPGAQDEFPDWLISPKQGRLINDPIPPGKQPDVTVEQRAAPLVYLYLCGWAMRVNFPIPLPSLGKVGDVRPKVCNRLDRGEGFAQGVVGNVGFPLYAARWRIRYVLETVPAVDVGQLVPANPLYGAE